MLGENQVDAELVDSQQIQPFLLHKSIILNLVKEFLNTKRLIN